MRLPSLVMLGAIASDRVRAERAASEGRNWTARPGWSRRSAGSPGPAGAPGPSTNAPAIKVITLPCDQTACAANCDQNEQILNAYALNPAGVIGFIDERNVTFRPRERPAVLMLACIAK